MSDVVVAIDIGGTTIKCALVDTDREIRREQRHATNADRGPQAVVETVQAIARGLVEDARSEDWRPTAVGVVAPGVIDERGGRAVWSANVGFRDVALRDLVEAEVALPTVLGHDVRAGGVAEALLGAGRGSRHVWFVAIGTGIAAANVVEGVSEPGAHGAAGELGHIVVRPGGAPCGCGARGCLEAEASAEAVGRAYQRRTGETVAAREVVARASAGEPVAVEVWGSALDALADGLVTGLTLFDPEVVVLGGGLAGAGSALLDPLREAVRARLTFQAPPRLARAQLGDRAGCLGAGLLALGRLAREGDELRRRERTAPR